MDENPAMSEGMVAPPAELTQDEKAYAGLAHALMISTWWIGPLVIFLIRRSSRFVSFHALQALLWQIIFTLAYIGCFLLLFAVMFTTVATMPQDKAAEAPFPTGLFLVMPFFWLVMMGGFVITLTLGIIYTLKAMRGEWAAYPIIGRWAARIVNS
jgi:uncharacterized Tic20 family protein